MTIQSLKTIDAELTKAGILPSDSVKRSRLASIMQRTGAYFGAKDAIRLKAHFAKSFAGQSAIDALVRSLDDGSWVELNKDLAETEVEVGHQQGFNKTNLSGIVHVSEENPYGWRSTSALRSYYDHDRPGEWNAYRQSYNLTEKQRADAGAKDYRIRGCTRWEVLGNTQQPTVEFDGMEVQLAVKKWQELGGKEQG